MAEEKIPVFIVARSYNFKRPSLRGPAGTARDIDRGLLPALRCGQCRDHQLSKLQLSLYTEKVLRAADQTIVERKTDIADFQFFQNVLLKSGVLHLHVILKVKRIVIIKVGCDFHFLSDLPDHTQVDLLVKLKAAVFLLTDGYGRVLDFLEVGPKVESHKSTGYEFYIASAEDAVHDRADVYLGN